METVRTEITIDAPAAAVWAILTDPATYQAWNPFIVRVQGALHVGVPLVVHYRPLRRWALARGRVRTRSLLVGAVVPQVLVRCHSRLGLPGLLDGEYYGAVHPLGAFQVRCVLEAEFHGLLLPLCAHRITTGLQRGLEQMGAALKARAERGAG